MQVRLGDAQQSLVVSSCVEAFQILKNQLTLKLGKYSIVTVLTGKIHEIANFGMKECF